ncbi:YkgJ family cysteine cluster protein [Fulvivirga sedimenti]|uniref:YkgJ family cysteine cluster protein n=1 Tax=Fulvivirga sedimenti TaxID=2879465 RepID=A0A9X1HX82_9BACT|nr:YkgJ family cysteine cluster protein [Fulvivirga sedimenti]
MTIYTKVRAVEKVFQQLEKEISAFQKTTGMHCIASCGRCCIKPDISATPLEFLPLAYHLFKTGEASAWYERLKTTGAQLHCGVFIPLKKTSDHGFCQKYAYRGLICRLFGFTAMRDKNGEARLVTCQTIKTEQPESYQKGILHAEKGNIVFMRDYYFRLSAIDPELGREMMPVNDAIRRALEAVFSYYAYRRLRKVS